MVPADTTPVVTFALDDRFFGSTGCNTFNSRYAIEGSRLDLQAAAVSKRACDPELMWQERRFLEAIGVVECAGLDRDGRLVLSANGQRRVAESQ